MGAKHSRHQRQQQQQQQAATGTATATATGERLGQGQTAVPQRTTTVAVAPAAPAAPGGAQSTNEDGPCRSWWSPLISDSNGQHRVEEGTETAIPQEESEEDPDSGSSVPKSSVIITICMLKMEANGAEMAAPPPTVAAVVPVTAEAETAPAVPVSPPKCGCFETTNCGLGSALVVAAPPPAPPPVSNSVASNNNPPSSTAKCGCNCAASDNLLNNNNGGQSSMMVAAAAAAAAIGETGTGSLNNNDPQQLLSGIQSIIGGGGRTLGSLNMLLQHHHLHHHHHHHHHYHHLNHLMHHQQQQQQQQQPAHANNGATSGGSATNNNLNIVCDSSASSLSASSPYDNDMKDKLRDLQLDTVGRHEADADEHPFSVGECPRCAAAAAATTGTSATPSGCGSAGHTGAVFSAAAIYNGNAGEVEEKILNTVNQQPPATVKQPAVTAPCTGNGSDSEHPPDKAGPGQKVKVTGGQKSDNAGSGNGSGSSSANTSPTGSVCCRQQQHTPTILSSFTSSGRKSRSCKCCTTQSTEVSASGKDKTAAASTATPSSGSKSKKGNWRLTFNCAKLRGSKSSSQGSSAAATAATVVPGTSGHGSTPAPSVTPSTSNTIPSNSSPFGSVSSTASSLLSSNVASKLLKGESEKADSCVCTAYRKVEEFPPSPPATSSSSIVLPAVSAASSQPTMYHNHHHHHLAAMATGSNHAFLFPTANPASSVPPASTIDGNGVEASGLSNAATFIHRAQPFFSNLTIGNHAPVNSLFLVSAPGMFDISRINSSDDFSLEDCDERARIQRELEIREGVDAPPNFTPRGLMSGGTITSGAAANHQIAFLCTPDTSSAISLLQHRLLLSNSVIHADEGQKIHSQVDFIHCLVPDLQKITSCCFYWGKMDRYEAEKLLEGKPEGTFLLRDSAQEEFLFSVSFRKYSRSLHARIEQFNHKFSFDSRDPGVYTASTVTGLLEHYKDPTCVMFFEPMLTYPLNRNFCFSLQQLCRATIVSNTSYDGINELCLPKSLKAYLKEYHYRQRVRYRPLDDHLYSNI